MRDDPEPTHKMLQVRCSVLTAGRGTVHYRNGSHHSAYVGVFNPDIGQGKHRYFGNLSVGGTKYSWTVVGSWGRV
jgi:hypothetical protein